MRKIKFLGYDENEVLFIGSRENQEGEVENYYLWTPEYFELDSIDEYGYCIVEKRKDGKIDAEIRNLRLQELNWDELVYNGGLSLDEMREIRSNQEKIAALIKASWICSDIPDYLGNLEQTFLPIVKYCWSEIVAISKNF